jgi:polyhydroxyalkanoate synthase
VERNALRARNGLRLVSGVARPNVGQTPKDVVWQRGRTQLWHYRNDPETSGGVRYSPPLLIVFSMVSRSYILDLAPGNSFVEQLLAAGFDVYLLDWGEPDERDAANTLEDYVDDYIPAGVQRVLEIPGPTRSPLFGYCFGGDLALLYAAHHPDAPVRSLTVLATPVDFRHMGPLADLFRVGGLDVADVLDADGNVPPRVVVQGFPGADPHLGGDPLRHAVGAAVERRVRRRLPGHDRLGRRPRALPRGRCGGDGADAGARQRHGHRPADGGR